MTALQHQTDLRLRERRRRRAASLLIALSLAAAPITAASAQHEHHPPAAAARPDSARADSMPGMAGMSMSGGHDMASMMEGPLGLSHVRMGSGTSWMPDSSPMHANHKMLGDWTLMLHGVAFGQYDWQGSKRGDKQFGIVDWEMLMAMRKVGTGMLHLHGMASLEPATLGARGYPLLLQTGESYRGRPLHDRQHPHDAIMELAALFQQPVARNLAVDLYGGLAGEPALGPVAFMHRPSAQSDPLAPLGHHWQDATHISYGVVTAGVYSRLFKLEGSAFNGREPDENRWNLDLRGLDSYSGRLTVNPTGRLSLAGWYGYMPSPEALHPDEPVHRYGASALYGGRGLRGGAWESTLLWGANEHPGGHAENSVVAESNLEIGSKHTVFGRAEYVQKSAEELVLPNLDPEREFGIGSLVAGYIREVASIPGGTVGVGGRASVNFVPPTLGQFYDTRTPAGFSVYVRVRPRLMAASHAPMEMAGQRRPMPGMPAMPEHAAPHDMKDMPGMAMPHDSAGATRHDSAAAHHEMHHDSVTAPGSRDTMPMHDMPGMPEMRDTSAKAPAHAPGTPSAGVAKSDTAHHAHHAAPRKQSAKKSSTKRTKKPAAPAGHDMPGMPHHMPGMKMPADTTRRPS